MAFQTTTQCSVALARQPVADPDIRNIRRCECQIFRELFAYKKMTIDKKINRIGKTYCNDSPVMAPQSVILLVTLRK